MLVLSVLGITLSVVAQAQDPAPRKVAEIDDANYFEGAIAQLDLFSIELKKIPQATGYIVVYRTERDLPGMSSRFALRAKNYLVKNREHHKNRIVAVDGGISTCSKSELWVVSEGATPPQFKDNNYLYERVNREFTSRYDQHKVYLPQKDSDCGWCGYEDEAAKLDSFAAVLEKEPQSRGYIIAYLQFYEDRGWKNPHGETLSDKEFSLLFDPPDIAQKILKAEKNYLTIEKKIDPSRIVIINGGYRVDREVELWIVPLTAPPPNPTPTTKPRRTFKPQG